VVGYFVLGYFDEMPEFLHHINILVNKDSHDPQDSRITVFPILYVTYASHNEYLSTKQWFFRIFNQLNN